MTRCRFCCIFQPAFLWCASGPEIGLFHYEDSSEVFKCPCSSTVVEEIQHSGAHSAHHLDSNKLSERCGTDEPSTLKCCRCRDATSSQGRDSVAELNLHLAPHTN